MADHRQRIFSIHFPNKKVYIENTYKSFNDKMEYIKNDRDHLLYTTLQEYPNPEIRFECYQDVSCNKEKKEVAMKYSKDNYEILNPKLFPPLRYNLFQSLYKWMGY